MKTFVTSKPGTCHRIKKCLTLAAVLTVPAAGALAQALWQGGTSDYNVAGSWNPNGVPGGNSSNDSGSNNVVLIQAGDPTWQHGDTLAGNGNNTSGAYLQTGSTNNTGGGNWLRMGLASGSFGSYILSSGVVNVGGRTQLGENGTGYLEIDGGVYNGNVNDGGANPAMVCGQGDFGPGTGTLVINGGTVSMVRETWVGQSVGTGYFFLNGGTYNASDWVAIGRAGALGVLTMTNGTFNKTGNGEFLIGTGGNGTMNQTGGVLNVNGRLRIGDGSTGVYNLARGPVNVGGEFWIGQSGTGNGTLNLSGTAAVTNNDWLAVGREGATGVLNMSGGTMVKTGGGNISIAHGNGSSGTINQTGGTFICANGEAWIGEDGGVATWNLNAGTATFGVVRVCENSSATGFLNVNGGTLTASEITTGNTGGGSELNLNGGTIMAAGDNANFLHDIKFAQVQSGGAYFDSNGHNITIPQGLPTSGFDGSGGLTKNGNGILTLSGANAYTGATVVNAGTLATTTATTGGGSYTVANGAVLNVQVVGAGAQLNMSDLTLASSATTLGIDLGGFGNPGSLNAPVNVSGPLAVNGTVTINIADSLPQIGQFPLIAYGSKTGSSYVLGTLPTGVVAHLVDNTGNKSIDLAITGVNLPRWDGQAGATWDVGSDTNWVNIGTGLATTFGNGAPVVFDDNAQGVTTVNVTTTVTPASVSFNNSTLPYALKGTGKISGAGGLSKQGSGSVTITNTGGNNYTGPTVISGGSVIVATLANGGSPSAIGAASANSTNLVLAGGNLTYNGLPTTINRGYTVSAGGSSITTVSNLTLTGTANATLGGALIKTGDAQLAYTGVGNNNLSGPSSAGYKVQAGTVLFDGTAGAQTNTVQNNLSAAGVVANATIIMTNTTVTTTGNMDLGIDPATTGTLVINNGSTLNVGSWFTFSDSPNSTGVCTLNGGTLNVPNGRLFLCSAPGTTCTLNINGGVINKSGDYFAVVNGGWNGNGARTGVVNQVSGTVNSSSEMWVGDGGGAGNLSLGTYNLSGGSVTVNNWFGVGRDGSTGIFNVTGGSLTKGGGGDMVIGRGGSFGMLNMTAGTFTKSTGNPLIIGQGGGSAEFDLSGGTVNISSEYWLGVDNTTTIVTNNISGTAVITVDNWVSIGRGGQATINFSGGTFNKTGNGNFIVGDGGTATFNESGATTLPINSEMWIGQSGSGHGQFNLSAGTVTVNSWMAVGRESGQGALNITGGNMTKQGGGNISIAHNDNAIGTVTISGGAFTNNTSETWIGENGNNALGTWNMNGGSAVLGMVRLAANDSNVRGQLNLNGGTLTANEVTTGNTGAPQRELNLNGGTLVAGTDNTNFMHDLSAANVQAGGAVFDTAGHAVSVNQALLDAGGGGGLTKNGNGTLYLNGANTYTGPTTVSSGTLGGTGVIAGSVTVNPGAALAPGASVGTLTVNGNLSLNGNLLIEVNKSLTQSNDFTAVTGALANGGTGVVSVANLGPGLVVGDKFTLFNKPVAGGGSLTVTGGGATWSNHLASDGSISVLTVLVNTTPAPIATSVSGNNLNLSWPADHTGWRLQIQTNALAAGLNPATNAWSTVAGSTSTNAVSIPLNPANPAVFLRMVYP